MRALLQAIVLLLCAALPAQATDVEVMPLSKVVSLSGSVAWGTIESTTARWADGHHEIETVLHLVDVEFIKGQGPETWDLVVPGGTLDGWTMRVQGAPEFDAGQRWMFFLLPEWKTHPCVGIWQGAYRAVGRPGAAAVLGGVVGGNRAVGGIDAQGLPRAPAEGEVPLSPEAWTQIVRKACEAEAQSKVIQPHDGGAPAPISTRVWPSHRATAMKDKDGRPLNGAAKSVPPGTPRRDAAPSPAMPMPREESRP